MGENSAALRAAVFSLSSKNLRGGGVQTPPPPAGRGLICMSGESSREGSHRCFPGIPVEIVAKSMTFVPVFLPLSATHCHQLGPAVTFLRATPAAAGSAFCSVHCAVCSVCILNPAPVTAPALTVCAADHSTDCRRPVTGGGHGDILTSALHHRRLLLLPVSVLKFAALGGKIPRPNSD